MGAAINFLTRKQKPCENIECYSKVLNELASKCAYKDCCRGRMLRDIFVGGLLSLKIVTMLITECEEKTFHECVERAKLLAQVIRDVEDINPSANVNKIDKKSVQVKYKTVSENGKKIPKNYQCIRCGTKNKHFASDRFALNLKCKICSKVGHIAKACKANKTPSRKVDLSSSNYLQSRPEEDDASEFLTMNTVRRHASPCSSHTCMYTLSRCETPAPAPKQRACSVPLCNRFRILDEEPEEPAPVWSRGHVQHQQSKGARCDDHSNSVKRVRATYTASSG